MKTGSRVSVRQVRIRQMEVDQQRDDSQFARVPSRREAKVPSHRSINSVLVCASCGDRRKQLGYCSDCSLLVCGSCAAGREATRCLQCRGDLELLRPQNEKILGASVDWLSDSESQTVRIGVAGLDRVPRSISLSDLYSAQHPIKQVIVCPDSEYVHNFSMLYGRHLGIITGDETEPVGVRRAPKSRYRVLRHTVEAPDCTVLLNSLALNASDIPAILAFIAETQRSYHEMGSSLATKELITSIAEGEFGLQSRYGLPFVLVDQPRAEMVALCEETMRRSWAEHCALKRLAGELDPSALSTFVQQRAEIHEDILAGQGGDLALAGTFSGLLMQYFPAASVGMALPGEMRRIVLRRLEHAHRRLVAQAIEAGVPSLGRALQTLLDGFTDAALFSSQAAFERGVPAIVRAAYDELEPEFLDLSGSLGLMEQALDISAGLSLEQEAFPEQAINDYLELCDRVIRKRDAHQLPALTASRMKLQILLALGYYLGDSIVCPRIEGAATETLARFEGTTESLKIPFPELSVGEGDFYLDLLAALNACVFLGSPEAATRLRELLESRKDRPEATTAIAMLRWQDFAAYEDYDSLMEFRSLLPEIRSSHQPMNELLEPHFAVLELAADGVLREDDRLERLTEAQLLAADLEISPEALTKEVSQYLALNSFLSITTSLYRAVSSTSIALLVSNLRSAVESCGYFAVTEKPESPNYLLYLKTMLLDRMASDDVEEVAGLADAIMHHPYLSENAGFLASIAGRWVDLKQGRGDPVLSILEIERTPLSPWNMSAIRLFSTDARSAYLASLGGGEEPQRLKAQGLVSHFKGIALELAAHVCFLREQYLVEGRVRLGGLEIMDLYCHRAEDVTSEALLADVKFIEGNYGPKEARDFATRVKQFITEVGSIDPQLAESEYTFRAVVITTGRISERTRKLLEKELGETTLDIKSGRALRNWFQDHRVASDLLSPKEHIEK